MPYSLSDNGLKAITLIVGAVVTLFPMWLQQHNIHVDRMEAESRKVEAIKEQTEAIKAALERKPLVFGENP